MNHHYRIIWSRASNTWVAVSEISKSHGKSSSVRKHAASALALLGFASFSTTSSALDLPTGAQVTAGAASVQAPANGALLINQSTQRAVIKWNDFSIGQGKQVTFAQPNAGAATLNIVNGNSASTIAGTLSANGSVYLINQNGIAITPTGLVDTRAGFIASTLRMDENAFMDGKSLFSGKGGSVVNRGQIITGPGGTVGLLGSTVANEGLISAPLGKVALGSGEAATLDLSGDGFLQVMLPTSAVTADGQALVVNSGVIQADGGMVMLKAATVRQALREAVYMPGAISARSISGSDGAIVLEAGPGGSVRVTGTLAADGEATGGQIAVTGDKVVLQGASLSAKGSERGGLVRVGGAFQGGRAQSADATNADLFTARFGTTPVIANATTTTVDAASSINVSASGLAGTGGTTVVWSDNTTVMQGAISAHGAKAGGAVEVSARSTVQSVALNRIDLGKGGTLLIDPQDIVIDSSGTDTAANYSYATPGTITHLLDADISALLSTGASVSLQASQDISWLDNFSFVTRTPTTPGGNLNLSAGRSVTLSGTFNTADGNWNIVANDTAAHGVVDAERGAGAASIDIRNANFINSNANLSLSLADGAGNTNREVDRITLGKFNGNGLTAAISSTAIPAYGTAKILLTDDINVSRAISLSGNLQVSSMNPVLSLSGQSVTWTDEKAGSAITGEGQIKFIENGQTTRYGQLSGNDAIRLGLGDIPSSTLTRTYGDNDLSISDILPAGAILSANSLDLVGPGVLAAAGSSHMSLSATNTLAFADGLSSAYFVDLAPAALPLTITQRALTPTVSAGAYIYGSPTAVASLAGVVNGDILKPVATLNNIAGITMANIGAGFGFAETVSAGSSNFSLTGLSGAQASNYTLDLSGVTGSTLGITRKALNYVVQDGSHIYGSPNGLPVGALTGIVAHDDVSAQVGLSAAGTPAAMASKLSVGTYTSSVVALAGMEAGNYTLAASGNTDGQYQVTPKTLTYTLTDANSTYGTAANFGFSQLYGVLAGDAVSAVAALKDAADNTVTPTSTLAAGNYREIVSGLSGAAGGNYQLASSGNQDGTLSIARKQITYTGSDSTQTYGTSALPTPALNGVVGSDRVIAQQSVTVVQSQQQGGSSAVPVGEYQVGVASLSGAESANYTVVQPGSTPGHAFVTPRLISYALPSSSQMVYGDSAPDVTFNGVVSGDLIQGVSSVSNAAGVQTLVAGTDVGSYTRSIIGLSGTGAGNYALAGSGNTNGNLNITPRSLTWQVLGSSSAVYGDAITNYASLSNLVSGDTVEMSTAALDNNGAALARPGVGAYSVGVNSISGPRATNYTLASSGNTPGSVLITPRPIYYGYNTTYSVYGSDSNPYGADSVYLTGVLQSEKDLVHAITSSPGYVVDANGTYKALYNRTAAGLYSRAGGYVTGLNNPNYILAGERLDSGPAPYGSHYISKKQINISSTTEMSITYGDIYNPIPANLNGIVPGDDVYATLSGSIFSPLLSVGDHTITAGNLQGYSATNYYLTQDAAPLVLAVKPKPVYLESNAPAGSLTYFGSPVANVIEYGKLLDPKGLVYDQPPVTVLGLVPDGETGTLIQPKGPGFSTSSSGAINAGTYTWTAAAFYSSNYVVMNPGFGAKALTITPKSVTAGLTYTPTVSATRTYGETDGIRPDVNVAWSAVRTGDDISIGTYFSGLPAGQDTLSARQNVGFYQINMSGVTGRDAANYKVDYTPSSYGLGMTVVPRSVGATINTAEFIYGNSIAVPAPVLNVLPGDSVSATTVVTNGTTDFESFGQGYRAPAGTYYLKLGTLTGASAANYKLGGQQDANAIRLNRPLDELALLSIVPRQLKFEGTLQDFSITYGDSITPSLFLTGVLPGDTVDTTPKAQLHGSTELTDINSRLAAGEYSLLFSLTGYASKNYQLPLDATGLPNYGTSRISVAKRATSLQDVNLVYGTTSSGIPVFSNVLAGDDLSSTAFKFLNATSNSYEPAPVGLLDAGKYYVYAKTVDGYTGAVLSGPGSSNYYLAAIDSSYTISVTPKMLTWTPNSNLSTTYGDSLALGKLSGFLYEDIAVTNRTSAADNYRSVIQINAKIEDSSSKTDPVIAGGTAIMNSRIVPGGGDTLDVTYTGYARTANSFPSKIDPATGKSTRLSINEVDQKVDSPLNAGNHVFFTSAASTLLSGERASNYQLPANMQISVEVKPRPISYSIENITRQYGNYEGCNFYTCPFNVPATTLGKVTYSNLLPADDYYGRGTVNGMVENIALIDANGNKGTAADITSRTPVGTIYIEVLDSIDSKNYVISNSGNKAGLLQIVPKLLSYSTSSAFYMPGFGMVGSPGVATLNGINNGEQVTAVVIAKDRFNETKSDFTTLTEGRYTFPVIALAGADAANYLIVASQVSEHKNDIGTLDVFADTRLGMGYVPVQPVPEKVQEPLPRTNINDLIVPVAAQAGSFGTTSSAGTTNYSAKAEASASAGTDTSVGGVTIGTEANAGATAGCNPIGCTAGANAHAETYAELSADDKLKLEADAYAKLKAGLSTSGVELSAKTVAQAAVEVAGSHDAGAAGDINYSVIGAAVAGAQAKGVASWDDGPKIVTGIQTGVGVSGGVSTGISGEVGSISAAPSIYSPGSFGGQFAFSPGYSDGVLSVSMNLGAQIGLGGLNLTLNVSLDLGAVSDFFNSWKDNRTKYQKARDYAFSLESDPLQQIAFLEGTSDWRETGQDISKLNNILDEYHRITNEMKKAKDNELYEQNYVLTLMKSDPAAALAYIHQKDFFNSYAIQENEQNIARALYGLNLHLGVNNGVMTLANGTQ